MTQVCLPLQLPNHAHLTNCLSACISEPATSHFSLTAHHSHLIFAITAPAHNTNYTPTPSPPPPPVIMDSTKGNDRQSPPPETQTDRQTGQPASGQGTDKMSNKEQTNKTGLEVRCRSPQSSRMLVLTSMACRTSPPTQKTHSWTRP